MPEVSTDADSLPSCLSMATTDHSLFGDFNFADTQPADYMPMDPDPDPPNESLDDYIALDGVLALDGLDGIQQHGFIEIPMAPYEKLDDYRQSWCGWMRRGTAVIAVETNIVMQKRSNYEALLLERPLAQHNVDLIIQALRCFPTMMMRRETFPWFIHRQSQLFSASKTTLPEALATCMGIAHMFTLRTPETRPLVWKSISTEHQRLSKEIPHMTLHDLLVAVQACIIYLVMCIVDQSQEFNSYELMHTLHELYYAFKRNVVKHGIGFENTQANGKWEHWIFEESRRRLAHLWFLIGFVVCIKAGTTYDASHSYRALELPSPKVLWEATTRSAWEAENEMTRTFQMNDMATLGDLIDTQKAGYTPSNARKLDQWNTGVDTLGYLLNLVGAVA
ncbi:hypothetical protein BU24DRAFT_456839 [Aaosphaeria arxii CBS 175.79]|uniref:Uncharacterized protein n=1 Tax=Aaosphaeria arxii CBS 175.79 TaxID=1450172 RepID=A0A6A5Y684_9PLEO|nr:uncharacterized protein BU24DRAFT_456839 [Aaosphaeria arxii CBS 175.79]KAF2020806.1 hypothetical protein BU24DRAFT_456839 [Aaosphaeria arxii CBS 175.79]